MIGWYVHHQGRGHLTRAACIAAALDESVVGLSTLPDPGDPFAGWLRLPADDTAPDPGDTSAGGALHWAPVRDPGVAERMAVLTAWAARERPRAVVVDVSVEAALTLRLAGVPVVVVAQPGDRSDDVHRTGYQLAEAIVAPWSRDVYAPSWLDAWQDKTVYTGAISRFDTRDRAPARSGRVVVLAGAGGRWPDARAAPTADARWTWQVLEPSSGPAGPWTALCEAEVVVSHGGLNALAEVAAARRPSIVIPQPRPFGEQTATARALQDAAIVSSSATWPTDDAWPDLLARAASRDPSGWGRWSGGDGAARAAAVVSRVAAGSPRW